MAATVFSSKQGHGSLNYHGKGICRAWEMLTGHERFASDLVKSEKQLADPDEHFHFAFRKLLTEKDKLERRIRF